MAARRLMVGRTRQANLTPMIDIVFQLIIFFLLITQFSSQQTIDLSLPSVLERQSDQIKGESRAIINVAPVKQVTQLGGDYRIGSLAFAGTPEGVESMASVLRSMKSRMPDLKVYIRADRTESYARVHPAMQSVTLAGVRDMELVTVPPASSGAAGVPGMQ